MPRTSRTGKQQLVALLAVVLLEDFGEEKEWELFANEVWKIKLPERGPLGTSRGAYEDLRMRRTERVAAVVRFVVFS